ncbi:hypothetical protein I4U23_031556 [Adineta vaga]|nr:hypothetical protein I4U23_031556 [Adineta vaga]
MNIDHEPIALIGIACEFAGDIHSAEDLWNVLKDSRDVGSSIPEDRFNLQSYCTHMLNEDNNNELEQKLLRRGYFLSNQQWDTFDASFFDLSDGEASSIDPCHRLLMMKFIHLIEDAGYAMEKMNGSKTSVHIGQFSTDHSINSFNMKPEYRTRYHGPNSLLYNASARLSYHFNLQAPNISFDAACSSSLEALHLAVQTLRTNEADMAVCGGVNGLFAPENFYYGSIIGAQSPDGRSRSFSADANGYAKADGLGLLLLKRLNDAERDGDRIYCIIHDVLSNHDGNENKINLNVPSPIGQKRLLTEIYSRTNFDLQQIFYIEAHGTGTIVGDPIEANCLGEFFHRSKSDPPLLIGSIKSNLGHTEGAAGVAGLIKIAMCMRYRMIPPNMHFTSLNPKIEAQKYNLHVLQTAVLFPSYDHKNPIAIGINSFGIGGNNVHAIVEEYQPRSSTQTMSDENNLIKTKQSFLFVFSTKNNKSLRNQIVQFHQWLENSLLKINEENPNGFLQRISKQLLLQRTISYKHLAIFVFANLKQLEEQIQSFLHGQTAPGLCITTRPSTSSSKICFVYSGQGPQWWAMGRQLYESEPLFRYWIELINEELKKVNNNEYCLIEELIWKANENDSRINDTNIAQPSLFAIQVALTALFNSWNIYPSCIVAHSAGEQAAAFVSGRVTLEEAIRIVYYRSTLQNRNTRKGGKMLAIAMSKEEIEEKILKGIEDRVSIAVVNSPRSLTLSGDENILKEINEILSVFYPNVFKTFLRIENAFHSDQMERFNIQNDMISFLKDIPGLPLNDSKQMFNRQCSKARFYSSVIGDELSETIPLNSQYWWSNVRECVRFSDAISAIIRDNSANVYLEISPHPVLSTSIRQCYDLMNNNEQKPAILSTLKRKEDEQMTLLTTLSELITCSEDFSNYFFTREIQSIEIHEHFFDRFPFYSFDLTSCWYESNDSILKRLFNHNLHPIHPLLGIRQLIDQTNITWKSLINLNLSKYSYLIDHQIQNTILFPIVAFIELALVAYYQSSLFHNEDLTIIIEKIKIFKPLILSKDQLIEIFTQIVVPTRQFFIYSRPWSSSGSHLMHSSGMSCQDFLHSFEKLENFNEFTLHVCGDYQNDQNEQNLFDINEELFTWSTNDMKNVYNYLSTRGYHYGPSFQKMKSLKGTKSKVLCEISSELNSSDYILHPTFFDCCLQPLLTLIPGNTQTFLPISIEKFIFKTNQLETKELSVYGKQRDSIFGLNHEETLTFDCSISSNENLSRFQLQGVVLQPIHDIQSNKKENTIFKQFNSSMNLSDIYRGNFLNILLKNYSIKQKWVEIFFKRSLFDESSSFIFEFISNINEDFINSKEKLNKLVYYYLRLFSKLIDEKYKDLFDKYSSEEVEITIYSTNLYFKTLYKEYPKFKSILHLLNIAGFNLNKQSLEETNTTEKLFEEIQKILHQNSIEQIFSSILQHFPIKPDDFHFQIFYFDTNNSSNILSLLEYLSHFSDEFHFSIDFSYINENVKQLNEIKQIFEKNANPYLTIHFDSTFNRQNFHSESFDLMFISNQLQKDEHLNKILIDFRSLLRPNGFLIFSEFFNIPFYLQFLFDFYNQLNNLSSNYVHRLSHIDQFINTLNEINGFELLHTVSNSCENSLILLKKVQSFRDEQNQSAWLIFSKNDSENSFGSIFSSLLPSTLNVRYFDISKCKIPFIRSTIQMMMKKYHQLNIIYAWPYEQIDLEDDSQFLSSMKSYEEVICGTFIQILQIIQNISSNSHPFLFVITRQSQWNISSTSNLLGSSLVGLVRSLFSEYKQHRLKLIDIQTSLSTRVIQSLFQFISDCYYRNTMDEIILSFDENQDQMKYLTYEYEMLGEEKEKKEETKPVSIIPKQDSDHQPFRLHVPSSTFLADLTWTREKRIKKDLAENLIEIRIDYVGINFRDVLKVRALYPYTSPAGQSANEQPLVNPNDEPGSDFVGTIVRKSSNVQNYEIGDHVLGISIHGVFHSHLVVHASQLILIPKQCPLSDIQLSVMPVVSLTVLYSLKYRVHLQSNQTVLIHAATGGAGQIAIQYCQYIGARILTTAGTEQKRQFLREYYGIEHVFNSRDNSFINHVKRLFPNGVDVIINCLSGNLLQESVKLLSSHGHFIEWGKRDIFKKTHVSMFDFRCDCSFHVIDLNLLWENQQNLCQTMLNDMMNLILDRKFKAIEPIVVYEPSEVVDAFTRCNNHQTMGKTVVRLANSDQPLYLTNLSTKNLLEDAKIMFPENVFEKGTIIISGGFGGVGLRMSRWMIEKRNVKRLVLMSRRTLNDLEQISNPQYDDWVKLKQVSDQYQADVDVVQVDVANFDQVYNLIDKINQTPNPVRGIIHSAGMADDRLLMNITPEHLSNIFSAKIHGAWNLHQITQMTHCSLHFFILFSSIRNHLLEIGSAGYNAGNQFLDCLATYRVQQLNLPALSISLPAINGAGMFHRQKDSLKTLQTTQGLEFLPPDIVFELIEQFCTNQNHCPCPIIFPVNWEILYDRLDQLSTFALQNLVKEQYRSMNFTNESTENIPKQSNFNNRETMIEQIQINAAKILGASNINRILIDQSLISQGMDSLAALSLYNWLGHETGVYIPLIHLLQGFSIETIANTILNKLHEQQQETVSSIIKEENIKNKNDFNEENQTQSFDNSKYTGIEDILCLQHPIDCNSLIYFYITKQFHSTDLLMNRLSTKHNDLESIAIYMIQIPLTFSIQISSTSIQEIILQIRRIQPRGTYRFVTSHHPQEELIARAIIEELRHCSMINSIEYVH